MTRKIIHPLLLKLIILLCCGLSFAQSSGKNEVFTIGESLSYEVKLSKAIFRGISVADINFTVARAAGGKDYLIKTEARSKGSLTKLFRFSFLQSFESTVEAENFRILKTTKRDEQGERVRDSEAFFDYREKRVTYIETDPNDRLRPPRKIASGIDENTQDLISGIYTLRRLPLAVGKTFQITVSDSGLVYKIPARVAARELQNTVLGKVWCFRVEPEVFGTNRVIEQKGTLTIWIMDDARRVPVRAQINTDGYKIEVKLKNPRL
ncbi:MAG TPA: DUF3108 domain-containing protein [Pyrinomonadaceae bacterium]|jgi:hypothetical protein